MNWLLLQLAVNVICCCLPTYGPFLPKSSVLGAQMANWYRYLSEMTPKMPRISRRTTKDLDDCDIGPETRHHQPHHAHPYAEVRDGEPFRTQGTIDTKPEDWIASRGNLPTNAIQVRRSIELTVV